MSQEATITFSCSKLGMFQICQRRYQLRYEKQIPWPALPLEQDVEAALERGRQFHQILERHFLKLSQAADDIRDERLRVWWSRFQESPPPIPAGQRLPEVNLTIPLAGHLLAGRFDLVVASHEAGQLCLQIFDWKTGKVQAPAELKQDWQTRLYLAMLAEGGGVLVEREPTSMTPTLEPEQVHFTYWHVEEPERPVTINYDSDWHLQNWKEIRTLVAQISQKPSDEVWPLTDDWSHCQRCGYQSYCGRQSASATRPGDVLVEDEFEDRVNLPFEPDFP